MRVKTMAFAAFFAIAAMGGGAAAEAQEFRADDPAWMFGQRPTVGDIAMSPDGRGFVYVTPGPGPGSYIQYVSLDDPRPKTVLAAEGEQRVSWCEFSANDRILCRFYSIKDIVGTSVSMTRTLAFDTDGGNVESLGQRSTGYDLGFRTSEGAIVDWLPDQDGRVLMSWVFIPESRPGTRIVRKKSGLGVVEVDTRTGQHRQVESPRDGTIDYYSDGRGNIRMVEFISERGGTGYAGTKLRHYYRLPGSDSFSDFGEYDYMRREGFLPLVVDGERNLVYGFDTHEGRRAIFSVDLTEQKTKRLVHADPEVDVSGLLRFGQNGRVVGALVSNEYTRADYFDKELEQLSQALGNALPGNPAVDFIDASADEKRLLVHVGSDVRPGRYYVFDRDTKRLEELLAVRPALDRVTLAEMKPVTYSAADGTQIPAYLTLPPGSSGKGLPAIVMPHGGPSARDYWGFDWLAQFFANRGYAVLQPNFRGSAGYGQKWFEVHGFRQWKTAIGDVDAGGKWLVEQGIAAPGKLGIVGWSYGGYAALQSGVYEPGLFKAIAAIAPVTDLPALVASDRRYYSYANTREYIGSGPHLEQGSPARNAERISVPVMLFHGDIDLNVDVEQSRLMHAALQKAGKSSTLRIYEDLDHSLVDSNVRAKMLREIDAFLARNIK